MADQNHRPDEMDLRVSTIIAVILIAMAIAYLAVTGGFVDWF
jgi:hypothetical protein